MRDDTVDDRYKQKAFDRPKAVRACGYVSTRGLRAIKRYHDAGNARARTPEKRSLCYWISEQN